MALAISTKQNLREQALAQRDALAPELRAHASKVLAEIAAFQVTGKTVSVYHAIGSEIDPEPLMQSLEGQGALIALPVLLDRETMVFRRREKSQKLVPVGFGTLGPGADQPQVLPDLIFAPLAAFSSAGQRIGYGKGHYDRALSKMHAAEHLPVFVGLAFDEQEVSPFEVEAHDIALDGVLTPTSLRVFEHGRARLAPFLRASELE